MYKLESLPLRVINGDRKHRPEIRCWKENTIDSRGRTWVDPRYVRLDELYSKRECCKSAWLLWLIEINMLKAKAMILFYM